MNKQFQNLRERAIQAAILASLLWLSSLAFGWPWLMFGVLAVIAYGLFCLGYAVFIWYLDRKR